MSKTPKFEANDYIQSIGIVENTSNKNVITKRPNKSTNRVPVVEVHQTITYLTSTLNNTKVQPQTSLTQIMFIMQSQCLCLPLKQRPVPIKPFSSGSDYYFLTQKQPNKSTPQTKPSSNLPLQKSQFSFRQDNKQTKNF